MSEDSREVRLLTNLLTGADSSWAMLGNNIPNVSPAEKTSNKTSRFSEDRRHLTRKFQRLEFLLGVDERFDNGTFRGLVIW